MQVFVMLKQFKNTLMILSYLLLIIMLMFLSFNMAGNTNINAITTP